jgi:hypothetical protein
MAKTEQLDIFQLEDGFYVGRKLKNGKLGKGAYKISGQDIMTMFTQFFDDFCRETGKTQLAMQDANGQLFVTAKVPAKKEAGEAEG